ncbi:MAG TPA: hypothetical protein VGC91_11270 [Pyrinomonadaceae bacterium]
MLERRRFYRFLLQGFLELEGDARVYETAGGRPDWYNYRIGEAARRKWDKTNLP